MEKNMEKGYIGITQSFCYIAEIKHIVNQLYINKIIFENAVVSHSVVSNSLRESQTGCSVHEDSPGKNIGMGSHALLQGIFPTQGSNPGLPHRRQILYHLSHQGSPRMLEWVTYPLSRGSSWPRNQPGVSCRWIFYQLSYQGSPMSLV